MTERDTLIPPSYEQLAEERELPERDERQTIPCPEWWPTPAEFEAEI